MIDLTIDADTFRALKYTSGWDYTPGAEPVAGLGPHLYINGILHHVNLLRLAEDALMQMAMDQTYVEDLDALNQIDPSLLTPIEMPGVPGKWICYITPSAAD